ncbi:adenylate/guanylate cyclase domain-containing protein [Rhodoferax koreense]|uniref:Adenylate/guanylate cyclase domain-containing protein n=2 Tax=Rhodoferax koreensis TaxID=1842727 RepID=A0A1P8K4R9_9BURK|nr:adenylate/guanylate cyclase domain-containing protein [Rhodoferax koreense]APW40986.1 adenylate/guanylate cyclase domain-containing protein [Rhodoferax koreense]
MVPVVCALLYAVGAVRMGVLQRLDDIIYDARLRATMHSSLDERIVIVDFDEKSQAEFGWPWSRKKLAELTNELFERQKVAIAGFDIVFLEPDESSGLARLQQLATTELRDEPSFVAKVGRLKSALDHDAVFARALQDRPVVLGYYFTSDRDGHTGGVLPAPVMQAAALPAGFAGFTRWNGFGANIPEIAAAAPVAGFFNAIADPDGVTRSVPLIADYRGRHYEALSLAMFRMLAGGPLVSAGFSADRGAFSGIDSIQLKKDGKSLHIPIDERGAALLPFRGAGGARGGAYRYISAADVLHRRLPPASLTGKIVLIGTTAPGLLDLRVTPVGETYPGVEMHANLLTGMLDNRIAVRPSYAAGYEVLVLCITGLALALLLPQLGALHAVLFSIGIGAAVVGLNFGLYLAHGLVLPLASVLLMTATAFALNMSYGYFVESRAKRKLASLFGSYVPPELVDEMLQEPQSYSMKAVNKELTVMFCDMRGFTQIAEQMGPGQLQSLLNGVFTRLTARIREQRGTIDKYMGDCIMAFWGAPVEMANHANLAVHTALALIDEVRLWGAERRTAGLPEIGIGIGINTGTMCVGDMGSEIRRSYTVIGDAVNLGARLEGLTSFYGVDLVVGETTRRQADEFIWQELDKVRVKGKGQAVTIFWPIASAAQFTARQAAELTQWNAFLKAYRRQDWDVCNEMLRNLQAFHATKYLYQMYADRVASMRMLPLDSAWDGATSFETK